MTAGIGFRSPLEGVRLTDGMREVPFLTQVDVRVDPEDRAAREAIQSVVGELPMTPNTSTGGADGAVLWLGPDEWLLVGPPDAGELESHLRRALRMARGNGTAAIIDVSAARTTVELTGPTVRDILESGCPIDLDPRSFGAGRCAQTVVARANVVLWHVDPGRYWLLVRPSFAAYLAAWLQDAASGAGVRERA